jgi:hypothetical protein
MYSRIRDPRSGAFWPPGSGIKKLGIRIRDKTSRIRNTGLNTVPATWVDGKGWWWHIVVGGETDQPGYIVQRQHSRTIQRHITIYNIVAAPDLFMRLWLQSLYWHRNKTWPSLYTSESRTNFDFISLFQPQHFIVLVFPDSQIYRFNNGGTNNSAVLLFIQSEKLNALS